MVRPAGELADELANLLGALVVDTGDALRAALERVVGSGGSGPAALVALETWPDRSVDFLAGVLGISHSGTVRLVDRLAVDGLVERRAGPDGRTAALRLTPRGARLVQAAREERHRLLRALVDRLTGAERAAWASGLERMLEGSPRTRTEARRACRLCDHSGCVGAACPVSRSVGVG